MAVAVGDQRRRKEAMELLVNELSKGDDESIVGSLRTALERGWLKSFPDSLQDGRKKKDAEIDRICSRHYADFLNSVSEMLKMRGSAHNLAHQVKSVHGKFGSSTIDLSKILSDLKRIQIERENTQKLLEMSSICREITELMLQIKKEIENDNHYNAMRLIESIQKESIQNVSLMPMRKTLDTWLPIAINKLLYAARTEADLFLQDLRNSKLSIVGNTLLLKQAKLGVRNEEIFQTLSQLLTTGNAVSFHTGKISTIGNGVINNSSTNHNNLSLPTKYSLGTKYLSLHLHLHYKQASSSNTQAVSLFPFPINFENCVPHHYDPALVLSSEGVNILENLFLQEMASIHKVLHLYAVLGNISNYYSYYSHNRYEVFKVKLVKNLEKSISSNGLLRSTMMYFEDLVGFFVIEIIIYRLIENNNIHFHTKELNKLWEETLEEFQRVCFNFAITLSSPYELIQIKEELVLILFIILDHNIFYPSWNIEILINTIRKLWDIFDGLQIQSLQQNIFSFLSKASFQPYQVTNFNTFYLSIKLYQLHMVEINDDHVSVSNASSGSQSKFSLDTITYLPKAATKKDPMSINRVEANLDALEQELSGTISDSLPSAANRNQNDTFADLSQGLKSNISQNNFVPQTYPFSEFVPLIMRELHSMLLKLLSYGVIPIPEKQNKNFMSEMYKLQSLQNVKFETFSHDSLGMSGALNSGNVSSKPDHDSQWNKSSFVDHVNNIKESIHSQSSLFHLINELKIYQSICNSFKSYYQFTVNVLTQDLLKGGLETILSKAVQIFLDSSTLSLATETFFNQFFVPSLVQIYGKENLDFHYISSTFTDIISGIKLLTNKAQDLMFELLSNKIENLLDASLLFIDFEPESFTINSMYLTNSSLNVNNLIHNIHLDAFNAFLVHDNLESIIEFLKITFMCLTHLPKVIRETVYYISCFKLASGFLNFLLSNKVSRLNVFAILSLDADCKRLVQFAESCGIMHLKECFDELSQMISAVLSPDLASFGENHYVRNSLFPRLNPLRFATLLEKIVPSPIVAQSFNLPKLDKITLRAVAKKLRSQPQASRDLSAEILL